MILSVKNSLLAVILCGITATIFGCTSNQNTYTPPVFKEITLSNPEIIIPDVLCTNIGQMRLMDSLFILDCNNSIDKKNFYIYHATGRLLTTFGESGNGPGELPRTYRMSIDPKARRIYAIGRKRNLSFQIDSILQNGTGNCIQTECSVMTGAIFLKGSTFFSENEFHKSRDYRFALLQPNGDTITTYKYLPSISEPDADESYKTAFYGMRSVGTLKPDGTKYASAITCGLHLEIFNLSGNKISLDQMRRYIRPKFKGGSSVGNDGEIEGIAHLMYSTDKYIYGLWAKDTQGDVVNQIAVFDWNGKAICRYTVNDKLAGPFAVESDDSKIYLTVQDPEGKLNIVKYNLK